MVAPVHRSEISFYSRYDLESAISLSPSRRTKPQRQDGLTGGTGFNINYSIILTEISFYPESSILLQIVRKIHMTNQIKLEKGFQKKPIVAFTNSTVFILDFNI